MGQPVMPRLRHDLHRDPETVLSSQKRPGSDWSAVRVEPTAGPSDLTSL